MRMVLFASQVVVGPVEPILSRRRKDVERKCVFQSDSGMHHIRWDMKHVAFAEHDFLPIHLEFQRTTKNITYLLVLMFVRGYDTSFFQNDVRQHYAVAGD